VCDALSGSFLGSDYNASVTSIIPTTDVSIAYNAAQGAHVVIIATDADEAGASLARAMRERLADTGCLIETVRLPGGQNIEYTDAAMLREAIEKAIVRAGLAALARYHVPVAEHHDAEGGSAYDDEADFEWDTEDESGDDSDEDSDEEELLYEINRLELENKDYAARIGDLENRLNEIMIDSYGRYNIEEVWESLFDDPVPDTTELVMAASELSDSVHVSGNFIFAQGLKDVEAFLNEYRDTIMQ
jgi:predicted nuclease with TOPRIM domain